METLLLTLIPIMFGALGTAIRIMWKKLSAEHAALRKSHDSDRAKNAALISEVAELKALISMFRLCPALNCPILPILNRTSTSNTAPPSLT
jgi:hypothetical protein